MAAGVGLKRMGRVLGIDLDISVARIFNLFVLAFPLAVCLFVCVCVCMCVFARG